MSGPPPNAWVGAGLGALVGAAIDNAIYRKETVFVVPARRTSKALTLSYTFRF
jgi:hypothetical protein